MNSCNQELYKKIFNKIMFTLNMQQLLTMLQVKWNKFYAGQTVEHDVL